MDIQKTNECLDEWTEIQSRTITYANRTKYLLDQIGDNTKVLIDLLFRNGGDLYDEIAHHWNEFADNYNDLHEVIGEIIKNVSERDDIFLKYIKGIRDEHYKILQDK